MAGMNGGANIPQMQAQNPLAQFLALAQQGQGGAMAGAAQPAGQTSPVNQLSQLAMMGGQSGGPPQGMHAGMSAGGTPPMFNQMMTPQGALGQQQQVPGIQNLQQAGKSLSTAFGAIAGHMNPGQQQPQAQQPQAQQPQGAPTVPGQFGQTIDPNLLSTIFKGLLS